MEVTHAGGSVPWQEPDPHAPHFLQGVSATEVEPGKFAIHDVAGAQIFCGRRCVFQHAAKQGINMEHARRWTSTVHRDTLVPGSQMLPGAYARKGADQREVEDSSALLRPATASFDRHLLEDYGGKCENCGKPV